MQKKEVINYLNKLGLMREEAELYLDLIENGEGTPLLLSRHTGLNRTKVYRVLEIMQRRGLVVQEVKEKTTLVSPAPLKRLEEILKTKQEKMGELTRGWSEMAARVEQLTMGREAETKVKYYKGKRGIEQMVWNVLKAKNEVVGYTFRDLSDFVGEKFMDEFVLEFKRRKLKMRDIYGDEYEQNEHTDYDWGERISSRYLPRTTLAIPHQMDIYDEVVTFYSWNGKEVWGTEIYNEKVARMQKQLFELAWEKAREI